MHSFFYLLCASPLYADEHFLSPSFAITMGPVSWTYPAELVCTTYFGAHF